MAARDRAVRRRARRRSASRERGAALAERLYDELRDAGLDVLYDDRDAGPARSSPTPSCSAARCALTVGRRALEAGEIEAQVRRGQEKRALPLEGAAEAAAELWRTLP